jgi:hypothetical protein
MTKKHKDMYADEFRNTIFSIMTIIAVCLAMAIFVVSIIGCSNNITWDYDTGQMLSTQTSIVGMNRTAYDDELLSRAVVIEDSTAWKIWFSDTQTSGNGKTGLLVSTMDTDKIFPTTYDSMYPTSTLLNSSGAPYSISSANPSAIIRDININQFYIAVSQSTANRSAFLPTGTNANIVVSQLPNYQAGTSNYGTLKLSDLDYYDSLVMSQQTSQTIQLKASQVNTINLICDDISAVISKANQTNYKGKSDLQLFYNSWTYPYVYLCLDGTPYYLGKWSGDNNGFGNKAGATKYSQDDTVLYNDGLGGTFSEIQYFWTGKIDTAALLSSSNAGLLLIDAKYQFLHFWLPITITGTKATVQSIKVRYSEGPGVTVSAGSLL